VTTNVIDLKCLITFDWRNTPLESYLLDKFQVTTNDLKKLQEVMKNINIRSNTKAVLNELLNGTIYLQDVDKSYTKDTIQMFVEVSTTPLAACTGLIVQCHQQLSEQFDHLEDFESFSRRPLKYIPSKVDDIHSQASAKKAKVMFYDMKRDVDRKRLAADLEIKVSSTSHP
jgi:hypothetical protein